VITVLYANADSGSDIDASGNCVAHVKDVLSGGATVNDDDAFIVKQAD
jgi:hypothetical protein